MRGIIHVVAGLSLMAVAAGCGGTINYNPATNSDTTPPDVNLLITRYGQPNLEVQKRVVPSPKVNGSFGVVGQPLPNAKFDFSVLATATDNESGIRHNKLSMTRTVCFISSSGNLAQAYFGSVVRKEATYTNQAQAPTQASLGDTGIIDNSIINNDPTRPANLTDDNLLVRKDANQVPHLGVGVSTKWVMEATNFAGDTTYSEVIFILAGDTSCVTTP